jgi:hypothetical protein
MRNLRSGVFGLSCVLGGVFLVNYFGAEAGAQQQTVTEALDVPPPAVPLAMLDLQPFVVPGAEGS